MATSLFSGVSNIFFDEKDRYLQEELNYFYRRAQPMAQTYFWEAHIDSRYEAGDSSVYSEVYGNIPSLRRKQFTYNLIRPAVNMVDGIQRKNRKSLICTPIENGDQLTADQFTKILMWLDQREMMYDSISRAFREAVITGMSFLNVSMDWMNDPISGDIKLTSTPYCSRIVDPFFRNRDLSDCTGIWERNYLTPGKLLQMYPDYKDYISQIQGSVGDNYTQGMFPLMPQNWGTDMARLIPYDTYFYPTTRKQTLLVDVMSGEKFEWTGHNDNVLTEFLRSKPQVTTIDRDIPTVHVAIMINGKCVYNGAQPSQLDSYPFVPVFGYYNPDIAEYHLRIQGIVRSQRDPQFLYNRRMAIELDCLESVVNSGWVYKENALVDPSSVFFNGQGRGISIKKNAQMTDVQPIQPPQIPQTTQALRDTLENLVMRVTGISEENLGVNTDDMSGILSMVRQSAGLTGLQPLLDGLDTSMKLLGKKLIEVIQRNFTPGKVARIIGEEPSQQFYNRTFGTYDAAVEEGFNTTTQRQLEFAQLLQLRQLGVAGVTDDVLLNAATVQNKNNLVQNAQRMQEQQQQLQEARQQVEMQEINARVNLADARAGEARGLEAERYSRMAENQALAVERMAEANKDDELAALHKVKAIKELESLDLAQLETLIKLADMIKQEERDDTPGVAQQQTSV